MTKSILTRRGFIVAAGASGLAAAAKLSGLCWCGKQRILNSTPDPHSTTPLYPPRDLPRAGESIRELDLELVLSRHEILPGVVIPAFTYNGQYPGPALRAKEGEWIQVNFTNRTSELHTIHWHGIQLACEMDGVPLGTQWPVGRNQAFKYLFRAQPVGTHFYHCHNMTNLHVQAGMFGALIVEPSDPHKDPIRQAYPYEREYTLALSEVDTHYIERHMNEMLEMMDQMEAMNQSPALMKEMLGEHRSTIDLTRDSRGSPKRPPKR